MKIRSLSLALILVFSLSAGALANEQPPEIPDGIHITGIAGYSLRFHADDFFDCLDADMESLRGIMVIELPEYGILSYAGRALMENEAVTADTLYSLRYLPDEIRDISTGFTVLPVYADGTVSAPLPVSITLVMQENHAPVARDVSVTTYRNAAVTGQFCAEDPEGDALVFRVTSKAKRGEVEVCPDGSFVYTPFPNKRGKDKFTYVAVDPFGNTSEEARVNIKIEKQKSKAARAAGDAVTPVFAADGRQDSGAQNGLMSWVFGV
jgi:hypothetical protein